MPVWLIWFTIIVGVPLLIGIYLFSVKINKIVDDKVSKIDAEKKKTTPS